MLYAKGDLLFFGQQYKRYNNRLGRLYETGQMNGSYKEASVSVEASISAEVYEMNGRLSKFGVRLWSFDAVFYHPASQAAWSKAQNNRGAVLPFDLPIFLFKCSDDIIGLHFRKDFYPAG